MPKTGMALTHVVHRAAAAGVPGRNQKKKIVLGGLFVAWLPFSLPPHHPGPGRCPAAARCQRIVSSPDARCLRFSPAPSTLHHQLRVQPQHHMRSSQPEQCTTPLSGSFLTHSTLLTSMPRSRAVQQAAQPMRALEPKAKSVGIVMVALHPSIDQIPPRPLVKRRPGAARRGQATLRDRFFPRFRGAQLAWA